MPNFNRSGGNRDRGGHGGGKNFGRGGFGNRGFGGRGRDGGRPMMHKATCGECGSPCEVPFKPAPGRPVFCNNCFKKSDDAPNNRRFEEREYEDRDFGGGRDGGRPGMHHAVCDECGDDCEVPFKPNGEKPVFCNNCFKKGGGNDRKNSGGGDQNKEQFAILNAKLDRILKALAPNAPAAMPKEKNPEHKEPAMKDEAGKEGKPAKEPKEPKAKKKAKKVKAE